MLRMDSGHSVFRWALALAAMLALGSCGRGDTSVGADTSRGVRTPQASASDFTAQAREWADSVMLRMDTAELAGQLLMPASFSTSDAPTLAQAVRYARDIHAGGIVWLRGDTLSMRLLADSVAAVARVPLFMAVDAEWGLAMRFSGMPEYRRNPDLAHVADDVMYDYGRAVGRDARRLGLNMVLAPVLDVASSPSSVMRRRSFGPDPDVVAAKGCAFARGLADSGVIPVAKHFPGLGGATVDSHKELPAVEKDVRDVEATDLLPFREYVGMGIGAVMVGHVYMPALDSVARPATFSPAVISGLLRRRMGFEGLVLSDAMNMRALDGDEDAAAERPGRYVRALLAGTDLLVAPPDTRAALREIETAIADGTLPLPLVHGKVRRILFAKYCLLML